MPIPKMPLSAWWQVYLIITLFVVSLLTSLLLWHAGDRPIASLTLIVYAALMGLFSSWKRLYPRT